MSYFPGMQKGNLDSVKSDAHCRIKKETVALQGVLRYARDIRCWREMVK